jgi:hypothetical protein
MKREASRGSGKVGRVRKEQGEKGKVGPCRTRGKKMRNFGLNARNCATFVAREGVVVSGGGRRGWSELRNFFFAIKNARRAQVWGSGGGGRETAGARAMGFQGAQQNGRRRRLISTAALAVHGRGRAWSQFGPAAERTRFGRLEAYPTVPLTPGPSPARGEGRRSRSAGETPTPRGPARQAGPTRFRGAKGDKQVPPGRP